MYLGVSQFWSLGIKEGLEKEKGGCLGGLYDIAHSTHSCNFVVSVNSDALKLSCEYLRLFVVGELQTVPPLLHTFVLQHHCKSFYVFHRQEFAKIILNGLTKHHDLYFAEAVERAGLVAEAEGCTKIEGTHLERILPQLLLDF